MNGTDGDLLLLVADKSMEVALRALLRRHHALRIRPVHISVYVHPQRDPGCYRRADTFMKPWASRFQHALVILDHDGSGREDLVPSVVRQDIEARLAISGWGDRARAVVISPELEAWVWASSPHVEQVLGWRGRQPNLRRWLESEGLWDADATKPRDPRAAFERALHAVRKPRSSALFGALAATVSVEACRDDAFVFMREQLQTWFPAA